MMSDPEFLKHHKSDIFLSQREKRELKGHKVRRRRRLALCPLWFFVFSL